jgi:cysteinyl-tRNA synthetase
VTGKQFSRFWLHGAHLFVDGKKMSKSKGNILYTDDIINMDFRPDHLRFFLIYGNYREKLNYTEKSFIETSEILDNFTSKFKKLIDLRSCGIISDELVKKLISKILPEFEKAMNNDLDLKRAFDELNFTIDELLGYKLQGRLTKTDCKNIHNCVKKIDDVFQVLGV